MRNAVEPTFEAFGGAYVRTMFLERPGSSRVRQDQHSHEAPPVRAVQKRKRHRTGFEPFLLAAVVGLGIWAVLFWLLLF